jgi:Subtilase family
VAVKSPRDVDGVEEGVSSSTGWVHPHWAGVDWSRHLARSVLDPYLVWFDLLGFPAWFRQALPTTKEDRSPIYPILVELEKPYASGLLPAAAVPPPYLQPLGDSGLTSRYVTGRATASQIAALLSDSAVRRLQIDVSSMLPGAEPDIEAAVADQRLRAESSQVWIGIIDDGCAFAHGNFRRAGTDLSRIEYLWDQNPPDEPDVSKQGWSIPSGFGYGREVRPSQVSLSRRDEATLYEQMGYSSTLRSRIRHGTAVMDLSAGSPDPLARQLEPGEPKPSDAAGLAPIVFVELPHVDRRDTCATGLGVHLLNAFRYLLDRVERHASGGQQVDPSARVVVNLSYGSLAGPHDGTTMVEEAIDELIEVRGNLAVVMAAGNTYQPFQPPRPTHGAMQLSSLQRKGIVWRIQPDDPTDSYLEIWLRTPSAPASAVVHVTPPGGATLSLRPGQVRCLKVDGVTVASVVFPVRVPQSKASSMALVALAPTVSTGGRAAAPDGGWVIEVENLAHGEAELDVDIWIERDDLVAGDFRRRQQSYLEPFKGATVDVMRSFTSLGHGKHVLLVGAHPSGKREPSADSASGPGLAPSSRTRPDVMAPASVLGSGAGLRVAGTTTGVSVEFSGTSAAAACVSRWVANGLASAPPGRIQADDLRDALKAHARPREGQGPQQWREADVWLDGPTFAPLSIRPAGARSLGTAVPRQASRPGRRLHRDGGIT